MRTGLLISCAALAASAFPAAAQVLTCTTAAVPPLLRVEGLTERVGDIILECSGGGPNTMVSGNFGVLLSVPVTNKLLDGGVTDVQFSVETSAGTQSFPGSIAGNFVVFHGVQFTAPNGRAVIRISNLRAAANAVGLGPITPVTAQLSYNGTSVSINTTPLVVGIPNRGLLSSGSAASIACVPSSLPRETISFSTLMTAGTRFHSTRITEGFASAFQKDDAVTDHGVRFIIRYSGFPQDARLFVPEVIAGSTATVPTAGGDLGVPASGGVHTPSPSGSLLLARVRNTDPNGAGGTPVFVPGPAGSPAVGFDAVSEVSLTGGAGTVVYEVVDDDPARRETVQWPAWLAVGRPPDGNTIIASQTLTFAPVSNVGVAANAPIPRFVALEPPVDCTALNDCSASYLPQLQVLSPELSFQAPQGSGYQEKFVGVENEGGGILNWTSALAYKNGTNWVQLTGTSGLNGGVIRLGVLPGNLAPGVYEATLTINAGAVAGSRTLPIRLTITPAATPPPPPPPPPVPVPTVRQVVNAASLAAAAVVPGSLATVMGENLLGRQVTVTFDTAPARVLFVSEKQLNLHVPAELAGRRTAQLRITVDGTQSAPIAVEVAAAAPGVFRNGVLNENGSVNSEAAAALTGSVLQVFATGLPAGGEISAKIHDREIVAPYYAGPAPGVDGVQQVNFAVPEDLPTMPTELLVCATVSGQKVCSAPVVVHLRNPDF